MFYSQTFLAKKGPLGTVWCAAHLQHRLKKSHYTTTDIASTVDRIMFPEVPIALRMSGHLLLGVVRIYSKKVEYLYHDCNVVLIGLQKAFSSIEINLPENATMAKFESVTLPHTLDLDALEVDGNLDRSPDNHLKSQEEITLVDQVPVDGDLYVAIAFDEDITMDVTQSGHGANAGSRSLENDRIPLSPTENDAIFQDNDPGSRAEESDKGQELASANPMEVQEPASVQTDILHNTINTSERSPSNQPTEFTETVEIQDPRTSNQMEAHHLRDPSFFSPPELEVMRHAVRDVSSEDLPPASLQDVIVEQNKSPVKTVNEKTFLSPIAESSLPYGVPSLQKASEPPISAASLEVHENFGNKPVELALRSTPQAQQPAQRRKRRRQFFDENTVLTNRFMKSALENCSDLLRKKRLAPSSTLGVWKLKNNKRKAEILYEPLITGMSTDLSDLSKDYISTKPGLSIVNEQPTVADSPARYGPVTAPVTEEMPESSDAASSPLIAEEAPEPRNVTSPAPANETTHQESVVCFPATEPDMDMEVERLRNVEEPPRDNILPDLLASPARTASPGTSIPSARNDFTPSSGKHMRSEATDQAQTYTGTGVTTNVSAPIGSYGSVRGTPMTPLEERFDVDTGFSDIRSLANAADAENLYFLEADNTPASSQGTQDINSLSVRTRAVAQYLKRQSPTSSILEDESGELSLNKIVDGKTRKLCARMFFETLVLKSYDLIDVQQNEPYGDISVKVTPTLLKAQI